MEIILIVSSLLLALQVSVFFYDYGEATHFSWTMEVTGYYLLRHAVSLLDRDLPQLLVCLNGYPFATECGSCVPLYHP